MCFRNPIRLTDRPVTSSETHTASRKLNTDMGMKIERYPPRVDNEEPLIEVASGVGVSSTTNMTPEDTDYYVLFVDKKDHYKVKRYRNNTEDKEDTDILRKCAEKLIDHQTPHSVLDEHGEYIYKVELTNMYAP